MLRLCLSCVFSYLLIYFLFSIAFSVFVPAWGMPSAGQERQQELNQEKEKTLGVERTKEEREQKGKREEKRQEETFSRALEKAAQKALSLRQDRTLEVQVDLVSLAYSVLASLEQEGIKPFASCNILTDPPTPKSLGLKFEIAPNLIDLTAKEYWEAQASTGGTASLLNRKKLLKVFNCALAYASATGSAILRVEAFLKNFDPAWVGLTDTKELLRAEILNAIKNPEPEISSLIANAKEAFLYPCNFVAGITSFRCGAITFNLASPSGIQAPFAVWLGGMEIFGARMAGLNASFRLNSAWSLSRAWEKFLRETKHFSQVQAVAEYLEKLENKGKIKKAAFLKKKALRQAQRGRFGLNLSPLQ